MRSARRREPHRSARRDRCPRRPDLGLERRRSWRSSSRTSPSMRCPRPTARPSASASPSWRDRGPGPNCSTTATTRPATRRRSRYLIGDVDGRHPLAVATGYVNLGGLHQLAEILDGRPVRLMLGAAPDPGLGAPPPPIDRFRLQLEALRERARLLALPALPRRRTARRRRGVAGAARGRGAPLHPPVPARQGLPVRRRGRPPGRARHLGQPDRRRPLPQPRAGARPLPAERRPARRSPGSTRSGSEAADSRTICARCSFPTRPRRSPYRLPAGAAGAAPARTGRPRPGQPPDGPRAGALPARRLRAGAGDRADATAASSTPTASAPARPRSASPSSRSAPRRTASTRSSSRRPS